MGPAKKASKNRKPGAFANSASIDEWLILK
jgi:hypothetical protein